MRTEEALPDGGIRDVTHLLQDNECILNWYWPDGVPCVYIHKSLANQEFCLDDLDEKQLKLYTREEYKVHTGYRDKVEGIGKYTYRIFPCRVEAGKRVIIPQDNAENVIHITSAKAKIYFSIKTKKSIFQKHQTVKIEIFAEMPIPKDVLCYVKKEGSYPSSREDGIQYNFLNDFEPGRTKLPEIEIKKNDYIRIYFTDGKKYAEIYELIPE